MIELDIIAPKNSTSFPVGPVVFYLSILQQTEKAGASFEQHEFVPRGEV
jgi:hypothetical protein